MSEEEDKAKEEARRKEHQRKLRNQLAKKISKDTGHGRHRKPKDNE